MTPADIRADLQDEGLRWLRTPYHHQGAVRGPGGGVDCLMLLVQTFKSVGLVPADFDPRPYSNQWHQHRSEELYLQGLERFARALPEGAPLQVGDIVVWQFGRTHSHAGMLVQPQAGGPLEVLHALAMAHEVTVQRLDSAPLQGRPWRAYTVFKEQV
jgi:cell wall-associated NlpC family hydrolase